MARRPTPASLGRPVDRPRLMAPLVEDPRRIAVIVAPAGYGKTTLLVSWRSQDPRPFAAVTLGATDDDPACLASKLASAMLELQPAPPGAAPPATLEELSDLLASLRPSVLAIDGLDALRRPETLATVARLAARVPEGTTLGLVGRREPPLTLGRLRAQDDVVEVRRPALAMTEAEAATLLRRSLPHLSDEHVEVLHRRTGGWPAALKLAARAIREQDDDAAAIEAFGGDDSAVEEYVRQEVLSDLDPRDRAFLRRTSVIDRLGGPVCDAALGRQDSAATLRRLVRGNVPLRALDRVQRSFQLEPLVAQALRAELRRSEPVLETSLHRRVSFWHEREGDIESAVEHAVAGRDAARVEQLLSDRCVALIASGRGPLMSRWLVELGPEALERRPGLALVAALTRLARGERDTADRWAAIAVRRAGEIGDDLPSVTARAALVRAWSARRGVEGMLGESRRAYEATAEHGAWRSLACLVEGAALVLDGHGDEARTPLEEGALAAVIDAPLIRSLCLGLLAFVRLEHGDDEGAAVLAARGRQAVAGGHGDGYRLAALTFAASSLANARRGQIEDARADLREATARLAAMADAVPWYGALVRVALAHVQMKLSDVAEGRRLLSDAARLRQQADGSVALRAWIDDGWAIADDYAAGPVACPAVLTMAELRVLRLLPSHLTYREIGARLHISPNTVKTQAHAVYRKLDARSRSAAVANAAELGLVEARITRCHE